MSRQLEEMIQDLVQIQERQLGADELVRARIAKNESLILGLAQQYEQHDTKITTLEDRMSNYELNEEITDEQSKAIRSRAQARVCQILDYPNGDSDKYYQTFIQNLYAYLRRSHGLGSKINTTKKRHFDTVMRGIEAWHPNVQELKARKDKRDKANQNK